MAPRRSSRHRKQSKRKSSAKRQFRAIAKSLAFERAPKLRFTRSYFNEIQVTDLTVNDAAFQAPFQDIPVQLLTPTTGLPDMNQRLGTVIYPQYLEVSMTLLRKQLGTLVALMPQRYRVMVVRYIGEMDLAIDNQAAATGWDVLNNQSEHVAFPGQAWIDKHFMKGQVQILYDRTYHQKADTTSGVVVKFKAKINKKLTYETERGGAAAVGAGNIYLAVTSDGLWNLTRYHVTAVWKQMS